MQCYLILLKLPSFSVFLFVYLIFLPIPSSCLPLGWIFISFFSLFQFVSQLSLLIVITSEIIAYVQIAFVSLQSWEILLNEECWVDNYFNTMKISFPLVSTVVEKLAVSLIVSLCFSVWMLSIFSLCLWCSEVSLYGIWVYLSFSLP